MTLIKALCLSLLGYIILKHTNTKIGDIIGLIGILGGIGWIVIRELNIWRGE